MLKRGKLEWESAMKTVGCVALLLFFGEGSLETRHGLFLVEAVHQGAQDRAADDDAKKAGGKVSVQFKPLDEALFGGLGDDLFIGGGDAVYADALNVH